jgi:hypothetical protein
VGDAADLMIIADDPLRAGPDALRAMPVLGTLLNGRWTYRNPALA